MINQVASVQNSPYKDFAGYNKNPNFVLNTQTPFTEENGHKGKRNLYCDQPGMHWQRYLQHVAADEDHSRKRKTGTVCLRIYTGWGQAASPSYQPV